MKRICCTFALTTMLAGCSGLNQPRFGVFFDPESSFMMRALQTRFKTYPRRPALDSDIDIGRIDIQATEGPPRPVGGHECRSRSQEEVKYEIAASRHIHDRIGNQPRRLYRRMQCQILAPAATQGINRGIVPDIGTVAAVPAEFDHIEMGRASDPGNKDQFVLGSVQRSHSCIRLVPDTQVQPFAIDRAADACDFVRVASGTEGMTSSSGSTAVVKITSISPVE